MHVIRVEMPIQRCSERARRVSGQVVHALHQDNVVAIRRENGIRGQDIVRARIDAGSEERERRDRRFDGSAECTDQRGRDPAEFECGRGGVACNRCERRCCGERLRRLAEQSRTTRINCIDMR